MDGIEGYRYYKTKYIADYLSLTEDLVKLHKIHLDTLNIQCLFYYQQQYQPECNQLKTEFKKIIETYELETKEYIQQLNDD